MPIIDLDRLLIEAVLNADAPYLVGAVGDASTTMWSGSSGESTPGVLATADTVFRIVSMSKAIGATAAAILADRGALDWDAPVDTVLPQFASLKVLDGFDERGPVMRAPRSRATLRQLATHTSGLVYEFWDADIGEYLHLTSTPSMVSGALAALQTPLAFDPGQRWQYGGGVDWLGLAVSAIDGRSIDQFCQQEIFTPLQMKDTTFELRADQVSRLGDVSARASSGGLVPAHLSLDPPSRPGFYGMGHALYSTCPDYLRFLRLWLGNGTLDGVRLLSRAASDQFLANHIGDLRLQTYSTTFAEAANDLDPLPGVELSQSLGFARVEMDLPGRRRAGSQFWAGVLNSYFWLDPREQVAAVLLTQLTPFLDRRMLDVLDRFERATYTALRQVKG